MITTPVMKELNVTDTLIIPMTYFFYLDVNRLMITNNYVVKFQNRVVNHESRPVKSENS